MSTPMRHGPSQQGRTPSQHPVAAPTPQASTPFSNPQTAAAFSPHGPRSSPQQFKKSPATGTMIGTNTSVTVNFDSPSVTAAYNTLGINMNINDLNLDSISVGGLVAATRQSDEEDRKKRMEAVIAALWGQNSSRVSNQGLERLAIHLNLECLWEDVKGAGENAKTLIIAGQTMAVEVGITNHVVHQASLVYTESMPILEKHADKASAILLKDLSLAPGQSPLTKRLTQFRANLERLATLDKLSGSPGFNCHEAIAGIWESLERLHRWDVEKLRHEDRAFIRMSDERLRVFSLCLRNGCPLMHARGRIGLSLDYWKERRKLASTTVDTDDAKTWGILIECAPASGMVYSPVRVSDKWISPDIEKSHITETDMMQTSVPFLDWLEPPTTLLPSSEEVKTEGGLEGLPGPKTPDVVFMATFDPPVIVPHAVAMEIYKISATNVPLTNITFDALMFPIPEGSPYDPSEPREFTFIQTIPTFSQSPQAEPTLKAHRNTLFIYKPVYGQVVNHVPFAHPKDLVAMLPLLRQYAFLSLLLTNMFKPKEGKPSTTESSEEDSHQPVTQKDEFEQFMSTKTSKEKSVPKNALKVDLTLTAHPVPRLLLVFPFNGDTANVLLEIQIGGRVAIISENILKPTSDSQGMEQFRRSDWANALETMEDIGAWIELIKRTLEEE
ncbi:mediator of RNA polymerase II transcription subunit 1-domain-containing protein [Annulohypoxylon maeteangense]|uniref:mediator of RNA polymerase II transcription subunit 1-domain-containing protein n=1 Tax=Annulohypoxylon maeteangense TaxID=1927788 RepID=UPI002007E694|nr:mediator of RNA polymerase II transcription subunit 1-domain-containing protein [Annulohypoxylon maeteangense]KAI0881824.1 mediator of RNA polymerase II transcription subunit 1-domain-containing protein [Annulohypoxylon maeteangense]